MHENNILFGEMSWKKANMPTKMKEHQQSYYYHQNERTLTKVLMTTRMKEH